MNGAASAVDDEPDLATLLPALPRARLDAVLGRALGPRWRVAGVDGASLMGAPEPHPEEGAEPLSLDFEVLGTLRAPAAPEALGMAARWLELTLGSAWRYRMAARLHADTVEDDFRSLQASHAALTASEARYRALAASLECQVAEQVAAIGRRERQLFASARMAAVGTLAAGVAHEVNNPIGFIRSNLQTAFQYVELLSKVLAAGEDRARAQALAAEYDLPFVLADFNNLLRESVDGAERVARIVTHLKAFAAIDAATRARADLNELVRTAAELLADQLPASVKLELALAPLPLVECEAGAIKQALFALLDNARRALPAGGTILVATVRLPGHVCIAVQDNGCGMTEAVRARAFDPFFTTRDVGQGTGLGLTLCHDIASAHGGRVALEAVRPSGTRAVLSIALGGGAA